MYENRFLTLTKAIARDAMLILNRRVGESIRIGENVKLTVLGVRGNQVRVGIDAPKDVHILRSELLERDREEEDGNGNR